MGTDDESGWNEILIGGWSSEVCAAVSDHVEQATVGMRGLLIRTVAAPDEARYAWTEQLHQLVLAAILAHTGADLETLGSQAAWACYDEVWNELAARWSDGGDLPIVPPHAELLVLDLLGRIPPSAVMFAAAETTDQGMIRPLLVHGRMRLDVEGLRLYGARSADRLSPDDRSIVEELIAVIVRP